MTAFAEMNADPKVRAFFPGVLSREESDLEAVRIRQGFNGQGYGLWAVEVKGGGSFIGCVGLNTPTFDAFFTPCTEIVWRLTGAHWGKGYATEAARQALDFAFRVLELSEVVAFTSPYNQRSVAVMERLGMQYECDFDHPMFRTGIF